MHLLAQRRRIRLHKRVHILPAIQLAHTPDLRLRHGLGGIARAVAEDEPLDVRGADLASVVQHLACWGDERLRHVQAGQVEFGVAQGDEDLVRAGCVADGEHLLRV